MRHALIAAFCLASSGGLADTFAVPGSDPIATVAIPGAWKPHPVDAGVEATSPDGKVYIAAESVEAKDVGQAAEDGLKFFQDQGLVVDQKTLKGQDITLVNGLKAYDMSVFGNDKIGPAKLAMTMVLANKPGKVLMLYFWGDEAGAKANGPVLQAIEQSIQLTK